MKAKRPELGHKHYFFESVGGIITSGMATVTVLKDDLSVCKTLFSVL